MKYKNIPQWTKLMMTGSIMGAISLWLQQRQPGNVQDFVIGGVMGISIGFMILALYTTKYTRAKS